MRMWGVMGMGVWRGSGSRFAKIMGVGEGGECKS